ncbi:uncharacterized protein [Pyrus communis]|uniref:uncharacterized protein n=1 Tax=Pyrus communis TaxID=23211 RepID=UPI0035C10D28
MRRKDEESDEEVQVRCNKQNISATIAAVIVCQPTEEQPQWGGSITGRYYKPRNRAMSHANLINNYFNPNSVYTEENFRRRFQMRSHVFERLLRDVQQVNPYFRQKRDRAGRPGFSSHQKVTVALRMMVHKDEYLCEPNQEDLNRLIRKAENRGFPSMIGSLDCMH